MQQSSPFDFSGATALIVGGATGLGFAMAEALLAHGATVCISSRDEQRIRNAAAELEARYHGRCFGIPVDITSESSTSELVNRVGRQFIGALNIAINSVGTNVRNPIEKISLEEWEQIQRINITSAFIFSKAVFPMLKAAGWGRLINITSIFSRRSFPHRLSYAVSKGGLLQLTRTLALEWAQYGITVNAVSPGPFMTEINRPVLDNPSAYGEFCKNIPLGRFGEPREIATTCLFLASPASSYVTGAEIMVDGGWTAK